MAETYTTLADRGEAAFEIRGSEFIGYAAPAASVEEAEEFVDAVGERHDDATHNVPAYRVRAESGLLREWSSDDGEPSGSSGKPALNVLAGRGIENVVVVVTRYYGGTNLGVGGLVRAYSRAVKDAVDDAGTVEERPQERFVVTAEYDDSGTVRGILESGGVEFDAAYEAEVTFAVRAAVADAEGLRDRLRSATSGRVEIAER